jgi:hypothetical protein
MRLSKCLRAAWMAAMALSGAGCGDEDSSSAGPPTPSGTWTTPGEALEAALLSVSGTSAQDIWVVGAAPGPAAEGLVAHWDGSAWTRVATGQRADLWWVHALASDRVFIAGANATILIGDGRTFTRQRVPGRGADTVFGVWAAAPDDAWAVGGRAGRAGFLWHFDGATWREVPLPDDTPLDARGELPALFKVWGRAADDVYAVGGNGLMLHFDGRTWAVVPTDTTETLFTVHGNANETLVVGAGGGVFDGAGQRVGPAGTPLLQGVHVTPSGEAWLTGANGAVWRRDAGGEFERVSTGLSVTPASLHAVFADAAGAVWAVGGGVLTPALDAGVLVRLGEAAVAPLEATTPPPKPEPTCPADRIDPVPEGSIARRWNEQLLDAIRRDIPKPGVHARNLFHVSVAMYDAWAAFDPVADGVVFREKVAVDAAERDAERDTALSYAAVQVLRHRYAASADGPTSLSCFDALLTKLGLDPADERTDGMDAVALGNRIGRAVVDAFHDDGANEADAYADTTGYASVNQPLIVDRPGAECEDPAVWQELNLAQGETQNGIIVEGKQQYIGPNWGFVRPFALPPDADGDGVHADVETVPRLDIPEMNDWVLEVIRKTADLDPVSGVDIDISPGAYGNNPIGTNDGEGHPENPVTGRPYAPNVVPRGDFTRVLAEFWADGPKSETPPGHWNTLANTVSDALDRHVPWGEETVVPRLDWDVQLYLALNGAVHDAAITAWGIKRKYLASRPITLIRFKAGLGQSSDPALPSYDPLGLPLEDGLVELVTAESSAPGERHHHLRFWPGEVAVRSWLGEPGDRAGEIGGVGWIRARDWVPYQRRTFVTPAFPGLISGHSTFSSAGAAVLTAFTGTPYFPGGLGEFVALAGKYLVFEDGPSVDVRLQWATYQDAADQAGQSRLWGGIHIWPDDGQGRVLGRGVGEAAAVLARAHFEGTATP